MAKRACSKIIPNLGLMLIFCVEVAAQHAGPDGVAEQREAMSKLSFLAGNWLGPVNISRGPGEAMHLTQTEHVEYKLDGLVLLVEGKSVDAAGKTGFSALATIAYDETSHSYHFRAFNGGHYVDTELSLLDKGFTWSFMSGPARIVNTMHLTAKGEWQEATDVTFGGNPPQHSVDMLLARQP